MTARTLLVALAFVAAAATFSAPAEAGFFDMFKRNGEVPPPGPTPPAAVPDAGDGGVSAEPAPAPTQLSQASPSDSATRMDRMEQQMRSLTGQVEELTFQMRQLQAQIRAQSGAAPSAQKRPAAAVAPQPAAPRAAAPLVAGPAADPIGQAIGSSDPSAAPGGTGAPPRDLGQLPATAAGQPLDLSTLGATGGAPASAPAPTGNSRSDYDAAYDLVLKGDYDIAQKSFQVFLANYPGDPLAPDAQFWIGESLYAQQDFRGAADAFLAGYQQYPKSAKAPDMLLKLGLSLAGLGQRDAACATYAEVLKKYPKSSNALMQRVKTEQASASC